MPEAHAHTGSFRNDQQRRRRGERCGPWRRNMRHVIRSGNHEMIHQPEQERAAHRRRNNPSRRDRMPPRQPKAGERADQDDFQTNGIAAGLDGTPAPA